MPENARRDVAQTKEKISVECRNSCNDLDGEKPSPGNVLSLKEDGEGVTKIYEVIMCQVVHWVTFLIFIIAL